MPNFSFITRLEVSECFGVVVDGGLAVSAMSNLNTSCIKLELGLGFDDIILLPAVVLISRF